MPGILSLASHLVTNPTLSLPITTNRIMEPLSSPTIRIALIGAGLIGPRHARTVVKNTDTELVAIVDPAPGGATLATDLGVPHFKTVAELLQSPGKPDAAIICTPNHTHVAISKELASGGVSLLIEKPVSTDIDSGEDLLRHLSLTGVVALVGHHRRFNPYMVAAKQIVDSGALGRTVAISGLWALYKPLDYFSPPRTGAKERRGV